MQGIQKETNELNLRALCSYTGNIYWNFITPEQRAARVDSLEHSLWTAMTLQTTANNKKILFRTYQDVYMSSEAANRMFAIWESQKAPDSVKLTEDDYTTLALTIALKTATHTTVLDEQLKRIMNPDRKARLQFLIPALSPDSAERDAFFSSLKDINNRRKEAWAATALSYLNHPLRQNSFIKSLPAALSMLEEVQRTGDVFFPQNWLAAIFSSHRSLKAWQAVQHFLETHPGYNPRLKAKILQATDNLYRAQQINGR